VSLIGSLRNNYKQIITLIAFLCVGMPLLLPMQLPIKIEDTTMNFYNEIEDLKPGDVVVIGTGMLSSTYLELYPQYVVLTEHVLRKEGVKIIIVSHTVDAVIFINKALVELKVFERKTYGKDFVNLGFIAGEEAAIAGLSKNLHALITVDYYKNMLSSLPMLENINDARDYTMVIDVTSTSDVQYWLNQAGGPYGTKIGVAASAVKATEATSYYSAGQIFGLLVSLQGAAQYEILINKPGYAVKSLSAQSAVLLFYIALLVYGNITYFRSRRAKKI